LSQADSDIGIIDPYNGIHHHFETQAHAYDYFMKQVGLKKYQAILKDRLIPSGPGIVLIGFSVGASAIWGISHLSSLKQVQKAFCFYGSRIRQNTWINPIFDMELIFPEQEPHFDVDNLINCLQKKDQVTCTKTTGLHGFMNELSPHFDPGCYADFIEHLKGSLIP
jgi:dienelactone hydrolase